MGHFDKTICDCCVCPMQCVLKQLVGEEVGIVTSLFETLEIEIREVKNFIVSGIDVNGGTGNTIHIPICNIVVVVTSTTTHPDVKPIQPNTKGECVCCEDPITNLANSLIGTPVDILGAEVIIRKVGEGIVIGDSQEQEGDIIIFSSCAIGGIEELSGGFSLSEEETAQKSSRWKNLKKMSVNGKRTK